MPSFKKRILKCVNIKKKLAELKGLTVCDCEYLQGKLKM